MLKLNLHGKCIFLRKYSIFFIQGSVALRSRRRNLWYLFFEYTAYFAWMNEKSIILDLLVVGIKQLRS